MTMNQPEPPSIRWQREMEDHLAGVRESDRALMAVAATDQNMPHVHALVGRMQAHATAALALATANSLGDIELVLDRIADEIGSIGGIRAER